MDHFGLEDHEKVTNLHAYNHALFKNMMLFLDAVWEINVRTETVVALEDRSVPWMDGAEFNYETFYADYLEHRVAEEYKDMFRYYMNFSRLRMSSKEEQFDVRILTESGQWALHQVVLTPAFDERGVLDCVYLCAQNIQERITSRRTREQFKEALLANSYFHFTFTLSDGMIREDAISADGHHLMQEATGLTIPMPYDAWAEAWYKQYKPEFVEEQDGRTYSTANMRKAYARGDRVIEVLLQQTVPWTGEKEIVQISTVLLEDSATGEGTAWIIWRKLDQARQKAIANTLELQAANASLQRTVSQEEQFRQATLSGALMVYNINLSRDLIEDEFYEIVDGKRYPMLEIVGLTAPCSFDEFCRRWSEAKVPRDSREAFQRMYNRTYCLDAYERGERVLEIEFDTRIGRGISVTLRNTVLMMKDAATGDIIANVSGKDVSLQREEERRQREALREAYEAANAANAAKSSFLARMSHDIRTPMNAIIGMTAIARTHLDDEERVRDCLEKITVSSKHLLGLINEVLDMSKIESGKVDLQEEEFNLPELIDSLLTMVKPQVESRGHELTVSVTGIAHEKVVGDSQRIRQAFMNLMSNAIKYTPDGGRIGLRISEKPTNKPMVGCYEFIFEDNGIGMTPEYLEHIFEPFTRAEDGRVEKIQGTGLGMSITKNIVQMMNGTIDVVSELNKGTTFTVTIFLQLQPEVDELDELYADLPVLVVDDDQLCCEGTCEMLDSMGMRSEWVTSGRKAVRLVMERHEREDDFYAAIIDWKMPEMDGVETTRAIREAVGEDMPIVIISSYDWSEIEAEARAAGATAFIAKPLFKSRLHHLFRELVYEERDEDNQANALDKLAEDDFSGRRVLLVEDNDLNAEIAMEILGMVGVEVERAEDGKVAVDRMAAAEPGYFDLIFMDIQMPVMNGYEATRAIRALPREDLKEMPILAMSANTFADDIRQAKEAGMNAHIAKPLDFDQLEKALKKWLKKRRRH